MPDNIQSRSEQCVASSAVSIHPRQTPTLPIPEAGALLGMDRSASYRAAKNGFLPTVQISERRWVVPTAKLLHILGVEAVSDDE